jgi:hypothetical protein
MSRWRPVRHWSAGSPTCPAPSTKPRTWRPRDRLVAAGATVNGVVLDGSPDARGYYRDQVIGGPGAFLIAGPGSAGLEDLMLRKFLFDLVAAADAPAASLRR